MRTCTSRVVAVSILVIFTASCVVRHPGPYAPVADQKLGKSTRILAAMAKDGTRYQFDPSLPASARDRHLWAERGSRLSTLELPRASVGGGLLGLGQTSNIVMRDGRNYEGARVVHVASETLTIETLVSLDDGPPVILKRSNLKERNTEGGRVRDVTTRDGRKFSIRRVVAEDANEIAFLPSEWDLGPLAEFAQVQIEHLDKTQTILRSTGFTLLGAAVVGVAFVTLVMIFKESCPFIYSFDGERYVFDAEPYGGAISHGLKRGELCRLEHLRAVDGVYRLRVSNEVDETQHTDQFALVVVDHPRGSTVVADESGGVHVLTSADLPRTAREQGGRDVSAPLIARDGFVWQSQLPATSDAWDGRLRDELTLEFAKPEGAKRAFLLFDGCNTLWGSQMLKRYLALQGRELREWYALTESPVVRAGILAWGAREELYRLQLRVETPEGWVSRAVALGGGPFASEEKLYALDVSDIPGGMLRLRLTPPVGFWQIDRMALAFDASAPPHLTEVAIDEARDQVGRDVRGSLLAVDDDDLAMPVTGDWAELTFRAPAESEGLDRSIFAKVTGYYDIHLAADGEPDRETLARYRNEHDFPARFALQEYWKWAHEIQEGARP